MIERAARVLDCQREAVLAILVGLDTADLTTSVVPSGWTPIGMIEHLAGAERSWFEGVIAGADLAADVTRFDPREVAPFVTQDEPAVVVAAYRWQCQRSRRILAATPPDAALRGPVIPGLAAEIHTVTDVVLHMIEETARHAGHLDIARELLDGRTGLGPR